MSDLPERVIYRPPAVPRVELSPPAADKLLVVPVIGRPGPPGPPGAPGGVAGQIRLVGIAAIALSGHRIVTLRPDGAIDYASNTDPAIIHHPLWLTTGATIQGDPVEVLLYGAIDEPSWSWSPGPVYLADDGLLTQSPPVVDDGAVFLAEVGCATGPTSLFFDRQPSIQLT